VLVDPKRCALCTGAGSHLIPERTEKSGGVDMLPYTAASAHMSISQHRASLPVFKACILPPFHPQSDPCCAVPRPHPVCCGEVPHGGAGGGDRLWQDDASTPVPPRGRLVCRCVPACAYGHARMCINICIYIPTDGRVIACLQPRRIAATSVAQRVAEVSV
jgi:hypothetical protein